MEVAMELLIAAVADSREPPGLYEVTTAPRQAEGQLGLQVHSIWQIIADKNLGELALSPQEGMGGLWLWAGGQIGGHRQWALTTRGLYLTSAHRVRIVVKDEQGHCSQNALQSFSAHLEEVEDLIWSLIRLPVSGKAHKIPAHCYIFLLAAILLDFP